jgi:hypothetical protein
MHPGSLVGSPARLTGGTQPPEGHLGFVDVEAVGAVRVEARSASYRTVDVADFAAAAADDVVMVVPGAGLVPGGAAGGVDPPGESGAAERAEDVVDGLRRDGVEPFAYPPGDLVDSEVATVGQDLEYGEAWPCDP